MPKLSCKASPNEPYSTHICDDKGKDLLKCIESTAELLSKSNSTSKFCFALQIKSLGNI